MNITVLDGYTMNPGDLSWQSLKDLGYLTVYDRTNKHQIIERAIDAEIILINKVHLDEEIMSQLPKLRYIGVTATGYNIIDVEAARKRGITVTNIPAYSTKAVAQHTMALMLEITNKVCFHNQSVHEGDWVNSEDFSYTKTPLILLGNKVLGVWGYGNIGKAVAGLGQAFSMEVIVHTKSLDDCPFKKVSKDELFKSSDFLSIHTSLTPDKVGSVNWSMLNLMKKSAFLINTSRGEIINEYDLAEALNLERISGAALDVLSHEPPEKDNPLLDARNCVITPHNAWASFESRLRLMELMVENVKGFLEGKTINRVN